MTTLETTKSSAIITRSALSPVFIEHGVRISAHEGVRISGQHGVRISAHEGVRISGQHGVRISGRRSQTTTTN